MARSKVAWNQVSDQQALRRWLRSLRIPDEQKRHRPTDGSPFEDINIVGLNVLMDRDAHVFRRRFWLLVLSTCLALALVQSHDRLIQYVSDPISTTVRYLTNETLLFPSITLCPYREAIAGDASHLSAEKLRHLYRNHFDASSFVDAVSAMYRLADVYGVDTLWEETAWSLKSQLSECYQGGFECQRAGPIKQIFTVLGRCLHFEPPPVVKSGQFHGFYLKMCPNSDVNVTDYYMTVQDPYSSSEIRSLTHGFYGRHGWNKEITVYLKEHRAKSKWTKRCSQDKSRTTSQCVRSCFERHFISKSSCRMPYMRDPLWQGIAFCNGSDQLKRAEGLQSTLLWKGRGWHPETMCQCQEITCVQYFYETFSDSLERADGCAVFKVSFNDMNYELTTEEFAYDVISFLCDIGGTLGLLLGASVLTVVQIVDSTIRQMVISCKKRIRLDRTGATRQQIQGVRRHVETISGRWLPSH